MARFIWVHQSVFVLGFVSWLMWLGEGQGCAIQAINGRFTLHVVPSPKKSVSRTKLATKNCFLAENVQERLVKPLDPSGSRTVAFDAI